MNLTFHIAIIINLSKALAWIQWLEIVYDKSRRTTSHKKLFDYIPTTTILKKPNFKRIRLHLDYICLIKRLKPGCHHGK